MATLTSAVTMTPKQSREYIDHRGIVHMLTYTTVNGGVVTVYHTSNEQILHYHTCTKAISSTTIWPIGKGRYQKDI